MYRANTYNPSPSTVSNTIDKVIKQHNTEITQLYGQYSTERDRIQNLYFQQFK